MTPSQAQISAAHGAWEDTVSKWVMRRVNNYGLASDTWVVERRVGSQYPGAEPIKDDVAYHKFDGEDAERKARFFLRDKCIRAALEAALAKL